ncbi:hypothetical protein M8J75_004212 [Diaphorina citri]|nr:hypothetical protein M8J75_004212 [Diaphorina citri]
MAPKAQRTSTVSVSPQCELNHAPSSTQEIVSLVIMTLGQITLSAVLSMIVAVVSGRYIQNSAEDRADFVTICNSTWPTDTDILSSVISEKKFLSIHNKNFKCFLHCLYVHYDWMDQTGGFHLDNMKEELIKTELDDESLDVILFRCPETHSTHACDRAYRFTDCFWRTTMMYGDMDTNELVKYDIHDQD